MKRIRNDEFAAEIQPSGPAAPLVPLFILVTLTIAAYFNSLHGDFVFDDPSVVLQNPAIMNIHSLGDVLRLGSSWRQVLMFSYGFNYYLGATHPFGYHLVNLLFHIVNVIVVYFIVREIAGHGSENRYAAFVGAAVFGVHPLLSGAVSYIAGRSSVLCGLFYFLAILFFLKALDRNATWGSRASFFSLTLFTGLLAWQTKQEAITLPGILAAIAWLRSGKKDLRFVGVLAALPLVFAAFMWREMASLLSSLTSNKVLVSGGFDTVLSPGLYFRTYITAVVGYYFPRFVYPVDLSADPYVIPVSHWYSPEFLFSVLVLGILLGLLVRRKSDMLLAAGLAAILFSPLTAYAFVPLADVVLEHRAYIPGLGIALLAAFAARRLYRQVQLPAVRFVIPALVIVVLAAMTIQRNTVFANNIAFWRDAVAKSPLKARSHFNLGATYQDALFPAEAIREYQAALALKPDIHAAYSNMAALQIDKGDLEAGEKTLVELTAIAPDYPEGFVNLAVVYLRTKQADKALAALDRALSIAPDAFAARYNKAEALMQKGDYKAAQDEYRKAVYLRPDLPLFQLSLAMAYVRSGDLPSAEKEFLKLVRGPASADGERNSATGALNLSLAYQNNKDLPSARRVLEAYLTAYGNSGSPSVDQVRTRLASLP